MLNDMIYIVLLIYMHQSLPVEPYQYSRSSQTGHDTQILVFRYISHTRKPEHIYVEYIIFVILILCR